MSTPLTFMACRQNAASPTIVLWGGAEPGTTHLLVVVARRRLTREEGDAALSGQHPEAVLLQVPTTADALRDDISPAGEPRYYAVQSVWPDGSRKPLRFRAGPMSQPPESTLDASSLVVEQSSPEPVSAPSPTATSTFRVPIAAEMTAATDSVEPPSVVSVAAPAPTPASDAMARRRAAQQRAQQAVEASDDAEPSSTTRARHEAAPRPSSDFPIAQFGLRMHGATQTWDGLRVQWETDGKEADAFEVVVSDHPLVPDEVGELLSGQSTSGAYVKVFPGSVRCVVDNVTPREARGYYAVIARTSGGDRVPVGCVAQGWDECRIARAPFYAPDDIEEVRSLANGQVREARVQFMLWNEEEDVGAWREALRLVGDALVILPGFQPALDLKKEIESARTL